MVRLSIVKIEVWPFRTLFIYSYILSLSDSNGLFLLYRQVTVGRHWPGALWKRRTEPRRVWTVAGFWRYVWYFEILSDRQWRARMTLPSWAQRGFGQKTERLILFTHYGGISYTVDEMLQVNTLKWLHPKQSVTYVCPIKISCNTNFQRKRRNRKCVKSNVKTTHREISGQNLSPLTFSWF